MERPAARSLRINTQWERVDAALVDRFRAIPAAVIGDSADRLQGFAQQVECGAPAWADIGLTRARSLVRMQPAIDLGPPFAPMIEALYDRAMREGLLRP